MTHAILTRIFAFAGLVLFVAPVLAVDTLQVTTPDLVLEAWRLTAFDRSSGLVGAVNDILENREGNTWFATERGAQRYDGQTWTTVEA